MLVFLTRVELLTYALCVYYPVNGCVYTHVYQHVCGSFRDEIDNHTRDSFCGYVSELIYDISKSIIKQFLIRLKIG